MSENREAPPGEAQADLTDPGLAGWSRPAERLKRALERDEFELYCQPIRALAEAAAPRYPLGEVLVRMREEEQAMLPPGEFLPILEHYRMLPQLDRWVAQHLVKRLAAGARLPAFTMNLSSQTLEDAQFPAHVAGLVRAAGLRPGALIFEIEEAELLARTERVAELVASLKAAGAGVLIDGYGRKAVSFTPLLKVEPDYIKVEGSIVRKLLKSTVAQTKLDAILRVGSTARMKVIAECVEEPDILEKLRVMGVPYVQGFGIVRPQPIDGLQAE